MTKYEIIVESLQERVNTGKLNHDTSIKSSIDKAKILDREIKKFTNDWWTNNI